MPMTGFQRRLARGMQARVAVAGDDVGVAAFLVALHDLLDDAGRAQELVVVGLDRGRAEARADGDDLGAGARHEDAGGADRRGHLQRRVRIDDLDLHDGPPLRRLRRSALGRGGVHLQRRGKHHAVVARALAPRDVAVEHVASTRSGARSRGIAVAAAARPDHDEAVAGAGPRVRAPWTAGSRLAVRPAHDSSAGEAVLAAGESPRLRTCAPRPPRRRRRPRDTSTRARRRGRRATGPPHASSRSS